MKKEDILEKQQLTLENVINIIRKEPDKPQKYYTDKFHNNLSQVTETRLSRFFKENNIATANNLLFTKTRKTLENRSVFFWKDDLNHQITFLKFGNYICKNLLQINPIMIHNYKSSESGDSKNFYILTLTFNSNSPNTFFKYLKLLKSIVDFNIFSNSIGYECVTLTFKSKNSAIRFKKLLSLVKSKKFNTYTVFECLDKCNLKSKLEL